MDKHECFLMSAEIETREKLESRNFRHFKVYFFNVELKIFSKFNTLAITNKTLLQFCFCITTFLPPPKFNSCFFASTDELLTFYGRIKLIFYFSLKLLYATVAEQKAKQKAIFWIKKEVNWENCECDESFFLFGSHTCYIYKSIRRAANKLLFHPQQSYIFM